MENYDFVHFVWKISHYRMSFVVFSFALAICFDFDIVHNRQPVVVKHLFTAAVFLVTCCLKTSYR